MTDRDTERSCPNCGKPITRFRALCYPCDRDLTTLVEWGERPDG